MRYLFITVILVAGLLLAVSIVRPGDPSFQEPHQSSLLSPELARELTALRTEGIQCFETGDIARSRHAFARARQLAEEAGAVAESIRFALSDATIDLQLHRYRRAMRTYLSLRPSLSRIDDRELKAALLASMSWSYMMTSSLEEAGVAIDEALSLAPTPEGNRHLPKMLCQRALLKVNEGNFASALRDCQRALELADQEADVALQADILEAYGWELLRCGEHESAEASLVEAFRLRRMSGADPTDYSYRNLAMLRLAQGDLRSAQTLIDRSFEVAPSVADPLPRWVLHYSRTSILEAAGRDLEALRELDQALEAVDRLRLSLLPAETTRISAGVELQKLYSDYVDLAYRQWSEAPSAELLIRSFEVAERGRAAALRHELSESLGFREELPDEYWEVLGQLAREENSVLQGKQGQSRLRTLRHRLTELELETDLSVVSELPSISFTAKDIQAALASDTALIAFDLGEPRSYRWTLTRDRIDLVALPDASSIARRVEEFRRAVEGNSDEAVSLGTEIYQQLFGGIHHDVRWQSNWCLLLDGVLFEAPLPALVTRMEDGGPRYLVEEHSLRVLPAAALLVQEDSVPAWNGPVMAVSDPVYNRADPRWRTDQSGATPKLDLELARLAGSGREVDSCLRVYQGDTAAPIRLDGPEATVAAVRSALEYRPRILHFATHVVTAPETDRAGRIALSLTPQGRFELLGPAAVAAGEIRSEVVVMSGCASGAGKILPGEGLLGLTRAWLRAGVRNVAATLWPMTDQPSGVVQAFYHHLGTTGANPHLALQHAQVEMIHSGGWKANPSHWAAYFLISRR